MKIHSDNYGTHFQTDSRPISQTDAKKENVQPIEDIEDSDVDRMEVDEDYEVEEIEDPSTSSDDDSDEDPLYQQQSDTDSETDTDDEEEIKDISKKKRYFISYKISYKQQFECLYL